MRIRSTAAMFMAAALASTSAPAQAPRDTGGVPTETQQRDDGGSSDLIARAVRREGDPYTPGLPPGTVNLVPGEREASDPASRAWGKCRGAGQRRPPRLRGR